MKHIEDQILDLEYEIEEDEEEVREIQKRISARKKQLEKLIDYRDLPERFTAISYQHMPVGKFKTYAEAQKYLDRCYMSGYVVEDKEE